MKIQAALPLLLFCASTMAQTGTVARVVDGDTLVLAAQSGGAATNITVRLWGIDAPERGQPYGVQARRELAGLVTNKAVAVEASGLDRWGRTIGRVTAGGVDVNRNGEARRGVAFGAVRAQGG